MMATDLHATLTRPLLVQALGSHMVYGPGKTRHDDHSLAMVPEAASLTRDGGNGRKMMRDIMAKARDIAAHLPRLRARLDTAAADFAAAPDNTFEFGLQAILDGLQAQLITRRTPADQNARKPRRHDRELPSSSAPKS